MLSYNIDTGELNYKLRDAGAYMQSVLDFNQRYIYGHNDAGTELLMIDTASGESYPLEAAFGLRGKATGDTRTVLWCEDESLYLIDHMQKAWVKYSDYITLPMEDILSIELVTADWLCLVTDRQVYCYPISEDVPLLSRAIE